jgi:hypothetical protein
MKKIIATLFRPSILLLLLAIVFLGDLLFDERVFLARDMLSDFLPLQLFKARSLLSGDLPFWNPYLGGGKPFIAETQSQAFYPPSILFLLFKPATALNLYWLLHLLIGGLGVQFLCRQFKISPWAACLTATSFMCGTWLMAQLEFPYPGVTGVWAPWIFGILVRFHTNLPTQVDNPVTECWRQRRLLGILALLFAIQFFANYPEMLLYPCLGYTLYIATAAVNREWRGAVSMTLFFGAGGLLGLLITLPQIVPMWELIQYSERAVDFDSRFDMASMNLTHLLSLIFPFIGGFPGYPDKWWEAGVYEFWVGAFYLGAMPLMVIPCAWWQWSHQSRHKKILVLTALAMVLVGIILALGDNTPIYPWLHQYAPLMGRFRWATKFLIVTVMGLLILTALGTNALISQRKAAPLFLILQGLLVAISGILALYLWIDPELFINLTAGTTVQISPEVLEKAGIYAVVAWGFLALAYGWLLAMCKSSLKTGPLLGAGILLSFLNLWVISRQIYPTAPAATLIPSPSSITVRLTGDSAYRAFSIYSSVSQYLYSDPRPEIYLWAKQAGSASMWMNDGIRQQYQAFIKLLKYQQLTSLIYSDNPVLSNQALDLFGVKWLVTGAPWPNILWRNASHDLQLNERPTALPRFKLFNAVTSVPTDAEAWRYIANGNLSINAPLVESTCLYHNHIVSKTLTTAIPSLVSDENIIVNSDTSSRITLQTKAGGNRLLWFGDTWYPGWRAFIDNQEVPIHRVNYAFMGIEIPAGQHQVEFNFRPRYLTLYLLIAFTTLSCTLALIVKTPKR